MFAADTEIDTDTEGALRDARLLESVLAELGAVDEYEAVANAIAEGARRLARTVLVTLTVPAVHGTGTLVVVSGGIAPDAEGDGDADHLPVVTFSLDSERYDDERLPLLHLHGDFALNSGPRTALLQRFASHARMALRARGGSPT